MDIEKTIKWFKDNTSKDAHPHGRNILAKMNQYSKLTLKQKKFIKGIIGEYKNWKTNNYNLIGYNKVIIGQRVKWLNAYKKKVNNALFKSQSKLESSVNEEFMYFLFKDLLDKLNKKFGAGKDKKISLGGARAYSNLYFCPRNLNDFLVNPRMRINEKDQDFTIYRKVLIKADEKDDVEINIPIVSIEAKTYLDKTMLEGSIATAEKIKSGNPHCLFLVAAETYEVGYSVDPAYSRIDQIYAFRKEKASRENIIYDDVVQDMFNQVYKHLVRNWSDIEQKLVKEGKIL